jgi:hypothetical protein
MPISSIWYSFRVPFFALFEQFAEGVDRIVPEPASHGAEHRKSGTAPDSSVRDGSLQPFALLLYLPPLGVQFDLNLIASG